MFTPIRNTNIPLIILLLAAITMVSACKNSTEEIVKEAGEYEILMHFSQDKAYYSDSCKRYIFICGPQSKGCTIGILYRLDSLSRNNQTIRELQFITSHDFVEELGLENIDFYSMRWYALSDTAIISKAILTADNRDEFVETVME